MENITLQTKIRLFSGLLKSTSLPSSRYFYSIFDKNAKVRQTFVNGFFFFFQFNVISRDAFCSLKCHNVIIRFYACIGSERETETERKRCCSLHICCFMLQSPCHENADRPSIFIEHLINVITVEHVNDVSVELVKPTHRCHSAQDCNVHFSVWNYVSYDIGSQIRPFHFMTKNWKWLEKIAQFICLMVKSFAPLKLIWFALHRERERERW